MSDAPLLTALLSGMFAFLGVLVAQGVVVWSQRRRLIDDDARRWLVERRVLYAKLLGDSQSIQGRIDEALSENDYRRLPDVFDPNGLAASFFSTIGEIRLIGSDSVVRAADQLGGCVSARIVGARHRAEFGHIERLDVVGFSADTREVISTFSRGELGAADVAPSTDPPGRLSHG